MEMVQLAQRVATDPKFAERLQDDPEGALKAAGLQLSEEQMEAVCDILHHEGWQVLVAPDQAIVNGLPWWAPETEPPDKS